MAILQGLRKDDFDETLVKAKAEAIFADEQGYFYYKYSKNQNIRYNLPLIFLAKWLRKLIWSIFSSTKAGRLFDT